MNDTTSLPPQMLRQFSELADYLGKAQRVALEISQGNLQSYERFIVDLTPPEQIPDDEAWFWSKKWQDMEKEVNENIAKGDVASFESVEDLLKDLNS
jgi:hypothetical protein